MSGKDKSLFNGPGDHPSDGDIDDNDAPELPAPPAVGQERSASQQRYLPIEADSELRQKIEADPMVNPDHMDTLNGIKLLLKSEAEKTRVFPTLDQEGRVILDDLLEVAISEIEVEHATVVGVVNVMILRMLDIRAALKHNDLGLLPLR